MFRKKINNAGDYENLSEKEKMEYIIIVELQRIIREEYEKPEHEQDINLITECYNAIYEKTGVRINYSTEEIKQNVKKAMERAYVIKSEKAKGVKRKSRIKLTAFIAAVLLIATQFIAMIFGFNPIVGIYEMLKSNDETTIVEEGITYTYYGNTKKYDSIEKLIEQENLDFIYPKILPDGIIFKDIRKYDVNGYERINIIFNTKDLLFQINQYHIIDLNMLIDYELLHINEIDVHILNRENNHEAIFYHNEYEYSISYTEYDLLIEIIKNLGE